MEPEDLIVKKVLKATIKNFNGVTIKGAKGDSPTKEELLSIIKPLIPQVKNGEDYVLTEKDKKEIAKSVKVPVVEKIIEKTEVIVEQPVITNEIKEVAVTDTAEEIAVKLNTLTEGVDKKVIKGIKEIENDIQTLKNMPRGGFGGGVSKIVAGAGVTISPADGRGDVTINASGGGGGSLTKGIAEVDFGAVTQNNDIATVSVADATVTATSYPSVSLYAVATTDHDPDDYMVEGLIPYVTNVQNGVGFDISVRAPSLSWGKYKVTYQF